MNKKDIPIIAATLTLLFATSVYTICNDVEANACSILKVSRPNMCEDSCFAEVCKRTCKMCPLRCYQCDREFYPEYCSTEVECNGTELCVASQELSVDFLPIYVSGCMEKQKCLDIFGTINTGMKTRAKLVIGPKRDYALNGSCCDHDFCNKHDPQETPNELPEAVTRPTASPVQYDDYCEKDDLDVEMCQNLTKADPDICKRPCIAQKVCPQTCGTCRSCYKCVNVDDPSTCTTLNICKKNQRCVVLHSLDNNFRPTYKLGCADTKICSVYFGGVGASGLVGRRRQAGLSGHCCDKDYCNGPPPTTTTLSTTMMTTSATIKQTNTTQTVIAVTNVTETTTESTTLPTTTTPYITTVGPDPACNDTSPSCNVIVHNILCSPKDAKAKQYALENCPSTCRMCDDYYAWKNRTASTMVTTTPFPCVDELPSCTKYGPVFCLDTSASTRKYVTEYCAKTCNLCSEYFALKKQQSG